MSWNPMMGPLEAAQYKPGQLGAGVTIGNPQGQQDYTQSLGALLEQYRAA